MSSDILSDSQVDEIGRHAEICPNGAEGWKVPALCATVKALRAENAALREQVDALNSFINALLEKKAGKGE